MVVEIFSRQLSMNLSALTRRRFLATCAMASGAVAVGCKSRRRNDWEFLNDEDAFTLAGICDQIVPADDYPSASQAGVLIYIDRQLIRHYAKYQDKYIRGLKMADELSLKEFGRRFALLDPQDKFTIVCAIESTDHDFFEMVRNHTLEGYYGAPRHGGNRDAVSWRMLGLAEPPLRGRVPIIPAKDVKS
jgi:gluconate 2-dehydrogenase gamma chain